MGDMQKSRRFTVGEWTVEPDLDRIRRGDESIELEPRVMSLLQCLADSAGETVSTDDLITRVWAGRAVTDQPVYQGVAQLRKALGDDTREPRYIVTITKKGYRLIAPVSHVNGTTRRPLPRPRSTLLPVLSLFLAGSYFLLSSSDVSVSRERGSTALLEAGSIAILPFTDMSEDQGSQFLGDGIAEELIHRISANSDIRVVARTSSFLFRGQVADVQDIGRSLGADIILEGSVRRSGDRVRITAQLVDARDGYHIWSRSFEHFLTDAFLLQDQIASGVAEALQLEDGDTALDTRSWTSNAEAANAYYLAMYHMHKRRPESLDAALVYLQEAVQHDPDFALAYAGLANAYFLASNLRFGRLDDDEAMRLSAQALRKAESLDATLAEVIELLADEAVERGDFKTAETLLLQAIQANPNSATAYQAYGLLLASTGRGDEALRARKQAVALDPLSPVLRVNLGRSYLAQHRLVDAEREFRTSVELDPDWHVPYARLAEALDHTGRLAESIAVGMKAMSVEGPEARLGSQQALAIGYRYLLLGDFDAADRWLRRGEDSRDFGWYAANQRIHWLLAQDRFDEADSLLTYWAEREPGSGNIFRLGALYRTVMHQDEQAIAMFESLQDSSLIVTTDFMHWGYLPSLHLARLYRQAGRTEEADQLMAASLELLAETSGRGFDSPGLNYVQASLHALNGDSTAALESLRMAIDGGWSKLWFVERDPLFSRYRGTYEFDTVLDELRARLAAESEAVAAVAAAAEAG